MICGYKYQTQQGDDEQIACNRHKRWFRRTRDSEGWRGWRPMAPPTVIDGHIRINGSYIPVKPLKNKPLGLPN